MVYGMNNFYLGGVGILVAIVYALYRWGSNEAVELIEKSTVDQDKSLQQQQTENEQKLAQVNKDLASLYEARKDARDEYLTDAEKAASWNEPPKQS